MPLLGSHGPCLPYASVTGTVGGRGGIFLPKQSREGSGPKILANFPQRPKRAARDRGSFSKPARKSRRSGRQNGQLNQAKRGGIGYLFFLRNSLDSSLQSHFRIPFPVLLSPQFCPQFLLYPPFLLCICHIKSIGWCRLQYILRRQLHHWGRVDGCCSLLIH